MKPIRPKTHGLIVLKAKRWPARVSCRVYIGPKSRTERPETIGFIWRPSERFQAETFSVKGAWRTASVLVAATAVVLRLCRSRSAAHVLRYHLLTALIGCISSSRSSGDRQALDNAGTFLVNDCQYCPSVFDGTEVVNVTRDSDTTFKVKRSTCRGGGIVAASR